MDKIQPMIYKNLVHCVEYFGLSGDSMKALPEDELGKIDDDDDKYALLEPGSRNASLMELLVQPLLPILGIPFLVIMRRFT